MTDVGKEGRQNIEKHLMDFNRSTTTPGTLWQPYNKALRVMAMVFLMSGVANLYKRCAHLCQCNAIVKSDNAVVH